MLLFVSTPINLESLCAKLRRLSHPNLSSVFQFLQSLVQQALVTDSESRYVLNVFAESCEAESDGEADANSERPGVLEVVGWERCQPCRLALANEDGLEVLASVAEAERDGLSPRGLLEYFGMPHWEVQDHRFYPDCDLFHVLSTDITPGAESPWMGVGAYLISLQGSWVRSIVEGRVQVWQTDDDEVLQYAQVIF